MASRSLASSALEGPEQCVLERDMNFETLEFTSLSDDQLLTEAKRLAGCERRATAALLRSLMEVDSRRLYLREGCSSLFTYCTQVLHLSEGAAYNRIEAARAARRFPSVLTALEDGSLSLASARLLAPHFTLRESWPADGRRPAQEQTGCGIARGHAGAEAFRADGSAPRAGEAAGSARQQPLRSRP